MITINDDGDIELTPEGKAAVAEMLAEFARFWRAAVPELQAASLKFVETLETRIKEAVKAVAVAEQAQQKTAAERNRQARGKAGFRM